MTVSTHLPIQSEPPAASPGSAKSTIQETQLQPWQTLPTMYDLPSDNQEDPGLPDEFHFFQPLLLYLTFLPTTYSLELTFSACDLNLYYDVNHLQWYKRPDWFGVVGVPRLYEGRDMRLSYVFWQENVSPCVVVELLSPGREDEDLGRTVSEPGKPPTKWVVYEQILQIPYYFVFSRYTSEVQAFHLGNNGYEPMQMTEGRWSIPELGLSLGLWEGEFRNVNRLWLRWMTEGGELIPVESEVASAAETRASEAEKEAAAAKLKAEKLAQRLQELGFNPDEID